ncbi:cobalamin biosynthesis protein [Comamonas guangdongensis]|uniref:Cobalamin biosynthesis protein n=1 Tax=Comamonas guangdongensis TaxID=510515 RepID=A0ABV3ZWN3_9BURK
MTHLFAGWGFKSDATQQSFSDCWTQACQRLLPLGSRRCSWTFAMLSSRGHTSAAIALQDWAALTLLRPRWRTYQDTEVRHMATPSASERLLQRFATGSVSEALALRAGAEQAGSELLWPRLVSADRRATLAIAGLIPLSSPFTTGASS